MKNRLHFFTIICAMLIAFGAQANNLKQYPGSTHVYDRVGYNQWGDNIYLTIFGTTTLFNPSRSSGVLVQKQSFNIYTSGYYSYTLSGSTVYKNGTTACGYGTGTVYVSAGHYLNFEVVDDGFNPWTGCRQLRLKRI